MPALSRRAAFTLLCAATLAEFLTLGMFLAALPLFLDQRLDASRFAVGGIVAAFSISALALRPIIGRQTDRRGRKWFLVAAPVILLASSAGLATARSLAAVAALRLFQGCAGAAFYTAAATMATDLAPPDRRAAYIARLSLFIYGGFAVGPTVAEALVSGNSFGRVWTATAATATVALVCTVLLPETLSAPSTSTAGLRLVHPASIAPGLVLLTAAVGYSTISTFSPLYARSIGMASSGPLYLAFAITIIGVRLVSGTLADRYGRLAVALPGMLMSVTGLVILATTPTAVIAMAGVAAFGAGFALVFPALMAFTDDRVPASERGEALGSTVAFFDIGATTGGLTVGALADRSGFGVALLAPAALCAAGAAGLARLRTTDSRRATDDGSAPPLPEPAGT